MDRLKIILALAGALATTALALWLVRVAPARIPQTGEPGLLLFVLISATGGWLLGRRPRLRRAWGRGSGALLWLLPPLFLFYQAQKGRAQHRSQEMREQAVGRKRAQMRQRLSALLLRHPAQKAESVEQFLRLYPEDREAELAALQTDFISSERLAQLAHSPDPQVVLAVIHNHKTSPEVLASIYEEAADPSLYAPELMRNPRTPREILKKIHESEAALPSDTKGAKPSL